MTFAYYLRKKGEPKHYFVGVYQDKNNKWCVGTSWGDVGGRVTTKIFVGGNRGEFADARAATAYATAVVKNRVENDWHTQWSTEVPNQTLTAGAQWSWVPAKLTHVPDEIRWWIDAISRGDEGGASTSTSKMSQYKAKMAELNSSGETKSEEEEDDDVEDEEPAPPVNRFARYGYRKL